MHVHQRNNIMNQRIHTNDNMMQGGRYANVPSYEDLTSEEKKQLGNQVLGGRSTPQGMTYGDFWGSQYLRYLFRRDMTNAQKYSLYAGLLLLFIFLAYMSYKYFNNKGGFTSQNINPTKYEYF